MKTGIKYLVYAVIMHGFLLHEAVSQKGTEWYKFIDNPVFSHGDSSSWDRSYVYQPQVMFDEGLFWMWYVGGRYRTARDGQIGLATSADGIRWQRYERNPVFKSDRKDAWESSVMDFCIIKSDSLYYLYYMGKPKHQDLMWQIGLAYSSDGIDWTRVPEPVLSEGDSGSWDEWTLGELCVLYNDGLFHMWYTGGNNETPSPLSIGYATSIDGRMWSKHTGNPVLVRDSDSWDQEYLTDPWVIKSDSIYEMWYTGVDYNNGRIGHAISYDGINWMKYPRSPVLDTGFYGTWDGMYVKTGCVLRHDSLCRLYYSGWGGAGLEFQVGMATAPFNEAMSRVYDTTNAESNIVRINYFGDREFLDVNHQLSVLSKLEGEALVDACNKLAMAFIQHDLSRSMNWIERALTRAEEINYKIGISVALYNRGSIYYLQDNYMEAMRDYLKAVQNCESSGNLKILGFLYILIGNIHENAGNHLEAFEYYQKALKVYQSANSGSDILVALEKSGKSSLKNGDTANAIGFMRKRVEMCRGTGDSLRLSVMFEDLGNTYKHVNLDSALFYLHKALLYWQDKDFYYQGFLYENLGEAYILGGAQFFLRAESNLLKAISLHKNWGTAGSEMAFVKMAELKMYQKEYKQAREYLNKGLELLMDYRERESYLLRYYPVNRIEVQVSKKRSLMQAYHLLYRVDTALNKYKDALHHHLLEMQWRDSVYDERNKWQYAIVQSRFEEEQYKNQISNLYRDKEFRDLKYRQSVNLNIGIGIIAGLMIMLILLYVRQKSIKSHHKTIMLEQKLLRSQLNPHFIFNSIANIQDFILNRDPIQANDYLANLSKLIRYVLENSREDYVPVRKEYETIKNYLKLQQLRFPGIFNYKIDLDPEIDLDFMGIPPMLAQPFIENSIQHGFKNKGSKGNIEIRFILSHSLIVLQIIDDGVGRKISELTKSRAEAGHHSLSTVITSERLKSINKRAKRNIQFLIEDLYDNGRPSGTRVTFKIPFIIL